ncbi:hypothetical protein SAFG77S_02622 [Streptomyces afghaniensis]
MHADQRLRMRLTSRDRPRLPHPERSRRHRRIAWSRCAGGSVTVRAAVAGRKPTDRGHDRRHPGLGPAARSGMRPPADPSSMPCPWSHTSITERSDVDAVASGLGCLTQAAWTQTCRDAGSPGSPARAPRPTGKWAASSWRNASVSPSRATAANRSCSTTSCCGSSL